MPANSCWHDASEWFSTPLGRYLLEREQAYFDKSVADVFGYNAFQLGLTGLDLLRASRILLRCRVDLDSAAELRADFRDLPLASNSTDLMVLPHVLEFHEHPHDVLREAERVLMPEGQVVISGFNTASLWGLRRKLARRGSVSPWDARFVGLLKLKEWLQLLGFELNGGRFGCYAPPCANPQWLQRFAFMEKAGARWWPILGGVYVVRAVKRVHGMRVITPAWRKERARRRAVAALPQKNGHPGHAARRRHD